ncbi:MAG: peptidylprolyl isomerase [Salinivirgaceae bacterium]|jgi:peptidyl-prolyl cis-trans isomerase SurA|nr:peptidylprolyl isomerase [Salinivirgaceae bacterium]
MILRLLSIILLLSIFFTGKAQEKVVIDQVVAIVGRQVILKSDIENQALQMRAQGYYSSGDIKCEVLEEMLYGKLLVNQAILDSVEVGDAEIKAEMERRLNYFINQIGSEEKLEEYYKKSIPEIKEDFREVIKDQLLSQRMQQQVTSEMKVTPQEVKTFFKEIPKDSIPMVNTEFEMEQIIVNPDVKEIEVLRIKDKLREFKERITKGENFATMAVLYSEDQGSAPKGGELGFVGRGDLVSEFSAVAFNLDEGEVSKIVKTDYGYHIIQLIEKKGERINCRHILMKPRISPDEKVKARQKLDSVRILISSKEITFKEACWKYSEDEDTRLNGGVMVNQMTGNSRWEAAHLEPKIAYAISNLKVGEISKPFEADDQNGKAVYKIVLLKTKTEPHPANLKDDYQRIQDLALQKKQNDYMQEWVGETIKNTYIRINDDYKKCEFSNEAWSK